MKQIAVVSGKGGTGKTVLSASFAVLASNKVIVDCDVDAADLHLLLHPTVVERYKYKGNKKANIDHKICKRCEKCIDICRFGAISDNFVIDPISCEGCAFCSHVCPTGAIKMEDNISGEWFISETRYGPFVHAKLGIAEENSGKLVTEIRRAASKIAKEKDMDYVIIDGPPGIGCPVIASLSGVNVAVVVTEPTVSGIHDMQRVIDLASHFNIDSKVVINKYDVNLETSKQIMAICDKLSIEVAGLIPFSREVPESIVHRIPFIEYSQSELSKRIISIWEKVC